MKLDDFEQSKSSTNNNANQGTSVGLIQEVAIGETLSQQMLKENTTIVKDKG